MKMKTIAILTNFNEFMPGYSLTGIVVDQAHMLLREGHKVVVFVNEKFNDKLNEAAGISALQEEYEGLFFLERQTKFMHLVDYSKDEMSKDHILDAKIAGQMFYETLVKHNATVIFSHDFIFTGWNLPYYHAMIETNNLMRRDRIQSKWLHWVHSVPSGERDWWTLDPFGLNHHIVFPNKTEIMRVSEAYKSPPNRVTIIPHIKDIRNWYDFSLDTRNLLDEFPKIMEAEVIQVYPCSTDRLSAKQLMVVLRLFAQMKIRGKIPVFLVIANQWATGRQRKEDIQGYIDQAEEIGLIYKRDFIFTSEVDEKFALGISRKMIRELQLLSNLFIFPTREESFGLVGPEAAFSGAMVVANRSLLMMAEVMSQHAPAFEFGSFHTETPAVETDDYIAAIAMAILNKLYTNEAIMTKVYCRTKYNMDNVYHRFYVPNLG